ncbi:MAG: cyclase [Planctomycetota bacterium]|jgi:imidazoleglycerol phosphate synthase cyclase subunit
MLVPRIIACLDVKDGRVVKGVRFQDLRDAGDPVACARRYAEQGADELVLLDVSATREGRNHALQTVRAVRKDLSIPLTVGGGVRSVQDAEQLLAAGADKVATNSAAVQRPELLAELREQFGSQCTVLAVDAARVTDAATAQWQVVTNGGTKTTGIDVVRWTQRAVALGAGELLLTSWDRDGTRSGYDLELLREVCAAVEVPVIASGGAAHVGHLLDALQAGASAVLVASMLHDGDTTVLDIKRELQTKNCEVRL